MLGKYRFESVTTKVRTKDGKSYSLRQGSELLKLPSSIRDWIKANLGILYLEIGLSLIAGDISKKGVSNN
jgi:hypothetical protein